MDFKPYEYGRVVFDSRKVVPGCLFAALPGANVDGHAFVRQAFEKGAKGILVRRDKADEFNGPEAAALIPVNDVKVSLTETARTYRQLLKANVVGVTGSAGKTTVKEFTAAFLGTKGKTHATAGNYNNDLGLPITILECPLDADFLVLEMGTNHPGEIARLVDIAKPDAGIISSIGTAHIEFFKTQDGIAEEKGTLFRSLPENGFAVLGENNDRFEVLKEMCRCRTVVSDGTAPFRCSLPGDYNRWNMSLAWNCVYKPKAKLIEISTARLFAFRSRFRRKKNTAAIMPKVRTMYKMCQIPKQEKMIPPLWSDRSSCSIEYKMIPPFLLNYSNPVWQKSQQKGRA